MGVFSFFIDNDIELEIRSKDINDFLKTVVYSFKNLVVDKDIDLSEKRYLILDISDESFPINFFNELIFLFDRDGFVGNELDINIDENKAYLKINGERVKREFVKRILKAATYHGYVFEIKKDNIYLKMIIDI